MGKSKNLDLPATPTYQQNPNLGSNITFGSDLNKQLLSGDLSGNLSWLQPLVNPNNSAAALQSAQGLLQPQFRDTLNQITQSAANNNQLGSSTFTDALARSQSDLNSQYQSIVSNQAINDSNQANQNRLGLFQTGESGLGNFTNMAQNQTNSENSFNLENYQNLVAKAIQDNQNANKANGWQQALGMVSPIGHDYLQSTGINSVPGYGVSDVAKIGSLFMGGGGGLGSFGGGQQNQGWSLSDPNSNVRRFQSAPFAGAYASNGR